MSGVDPKMVLHRLHQVVTDQPLKKILTTPPLSGRITTWAVELSEFDITNVPRTSIKAQVLADFLIKCTALQPLRIDGPKEPQEPAQIPEWVVYVDGVRTNKGARVGIMINCLTNLGCNTP
ncbi:hypothetical protein LIER_39071 [Lithospermum erythrorhizon]|uniref:Uncharacterized protein n=1 Tax=Lithospermum erythrorhizon TaxID=34254 RepID=A0AAV3Q9Y9_LITER